MTARPGGDGNTARRFPHRRPHRRPPSTVSQTPAASAEAPDRAVTDSPPLERASQTLPCSSRAAHLPDLISFDPVAFSSPPAREDPKPAFPARAKQPSEKTAANTDKPARVGRFNATPRPPPAAIVARAEPGHLCAREAKCAYQAMTKEPTSCTTQDKENLGQQLTHAGDDLTCHRSSRTSLSRLRRSGNENVDERHVSHAAASRCAAWRV